MSYGTYSEGDLVRVACWISHPIWDRSEFEEFEGMECVVDIIDYSDGTARLLVGDDVLWAPLDCLVRADSARVPVPELRPGTVAPAPELRPGLIQAQEGAQEDGRGLEYAAVGSGSHTQSEGLTRPLVHLPFAVGDRVVVRRKVLNRAQIGLTADALVDESYSANWVIQMDYTIGRVGIVTYIQESSPGVVPYVEVSFEDYAHATWRYSPLSLELSGTGGSSVPDIARGGAGNGTESERFAVGDSVTVYRKIGNREDPSFDNIWADAMDECIGHTGRVTKVVYPGSGVSVSIPGAGTWTFSPLSLQRPAAYRGPQRKEASEVYLIVGGICETDIMLLLDVSLDVPFSAGSLLSNEDGDHDTAKYVEKLKAMAGLPEDLGEDWDVEYNPYQHTRVPEVISSAVLSTIEYHPTEDDEVSEPTFHDRLWLAILKVNPEEGMPMSVNLGKLVDGFFRVP